MLKIWNQGMGLDAAAFELSHPKLWHEYKVTKKELDAIEPNYPEITDDDRQNEFSWFETFMEASQALLPVANAYNKLSKARNKMRDDLVRMIGIGEVIALGYSLPRHSEDAPSKIPIDVWPGEINWADSSVSGNGLEFVAVRIMPSDSYEKISNTSPIQLEAPKPPRGRPTLKPMILEAYAAIKHDIDFTKPMTVCFTQIRNWLVKNYPSHSGQYSQIADETIRLNISGLFKEDIQSNKQ